MLFINLDGASLPVITNNADGGEFCSFFIVNNGSLNLHVYFHTNTFKLREKWNNKIGDAITM